MRCTFAAKHLLALLESAHQVTVNLLLFSLCAVFSAFDLPPSNLPVMVFLPTERTRSQNLIHCDLVLEK